MGVVSANRTNITRSVCPAKPVQVCDYCEPSVPDRNHPPEYAIDGTASWWQSPPLSRGMKYNEVNLTIDFGQVSVTAWLGAFLGPGPDKR